MIETVRTRRTDVPFEFPRDCLQTFISNDVNSRDKSLQKRDYPVKRQQLRLQDELLLIY